MKKITRFGLSILTCSILIACGEGAPGTDGTPGDVPKLVLNDTGVTYYINHDNVKFFEFGDRSYIRSIVPTTKIVGGNTVLEFDGKTVIDSGSPILFNVLDQTKFPKIPTDAFSPSMPVDFPGQDASIGNDILNPNNADGDAGFNFVKLHKTTGVELDISATAYGCVKDNVTGLIWEHKTRSDDVNDIHRSDLKVAWYDPDPKTNGGEQGESMNSNGACFAAGRMKWDSKTIVNMVKTEKLCGLTNWRMPTIEEMRSIINYQVKRGTLDNTQAMADGRFFPNISDRGHRWTSQSVYASIQEKNSASYKSKAFGFHMHEGQVMAHDKICTVTIGSDGKSSDNYDNGILLVSDGN